MKNRLGVARQQLNFVCTEKFVRRHLAAPPPCWNLQAFNRATIANEAKLAHKSASAQSKDAGSGHPQWATELFSAKAKMADHFKAPQCVSATQLH